MRGSTVPSRLARHIFGVVVLVITGACAPTLAPGDVGILRYAGRVKGEVPLNLLPPVADPSGNVYVLNGAPTLPETHVFVGFAGGGWSAQCNLTKGDDAGAHGWSGFATAREWYWSGGALVAVSGADGSCHRVLDRDPSTNADLFFQAVMPGVKNLSERTTLVALVQSPTDPAPFSALVELDAEFLSNVQAFEPSDAHDVAVIGVGGDRDRELGIALVQYTQGDAVHLDLRSYDGDAAFTDRVAVAGGPLAPYAVQGYLQIGADGLVAGLVASGEAETKKYSLFTADSSGGDLVPIGGMDPVGVHLWEGALWLVGVAGSNPVIASIGRGGVGAVSTWEASLAAAALGASTSVRDDRSLPSRMTEWSSVRTAMGAFPFLHAHSLVQHAPGTTLWLFAGPSVTGDALTLTSFAMAPVGVSYP